MSTVFPMHRAVVPNRGQPRALRPGHLIELRLRVVDLITVVATAPLARFFTHAELLPLDYALFVVMTTLLSVITFSAVSLYDPRRLGDVAFQMSRLAFAWLSTLAAVVTLLFVLRPEELPARDWVVTWVTLTLFAFVGTRLAMAAWIEHLRAQGQVSWNVVVVGSGAWGPDARRRVEADRLESSVVGYLDLNELHDPAAIETALREQLAAKAVDQVALALDARDLHRAPELLSVLRDFPVEVGLLPQLGGIELPTLGVRRMGDLTSVTYLKKPIDGWSWYVKSAFDRIAAFFLLLFLLPLLVVIGIMVKATSPGPVFFRQTRLGFNQQPINVFKFRSMYTDRCDAMASREVQQATRNDPRITPVGNFLRRSSLDELPQLINVLYGEMSLVGPRPHAVAHDEYYATLIDGYLGRHRAKPGITGWAQVSGCRGEVHTLEDMRRRIELDLHYIDNWSLAFDVRILLRTVLVCFRDEQAY